VAFDADVVAGRQLVGCGLFDGKIGFFNLKEKDLFIKNSVFLTYRI